MVLGRSSSRTKNSRFRRLCTFIRPVHPDFQIRMPRVSGFSIRLCKSVRTIVGLQILIFEAGGLGYELVRLVCPRNPPERIGNFTRTDWEIHQNGEIHPNGVAGLSILHERIDSSQNLRNTKQPLNAQRLRAACGSAGSAAWIRLRTCSLGLSKKSTRTEPWLE